MAVRHRLAVLHSKRRGAVSLYLWAGGRYWYWATFSGSSLRPRHGACSTAYGHALIMRLRCCPPQAAVLCAAAGVACVSLAFLCGNQSCLECHLLCLSSLPLLRCTNLSALYLVVVQRLGGCRAIAAFEGCQLCQGWSAAAGSASASGNCIAAENRHANTCRQLCQLTVIVIVMLEHPVIFSGSPIEVPPGCLCHAGYGCWVVCLSRVP